MTSLFMKIVEMFLGGALSRVLDTVDKKLENDTERQALRADAVKHYMDREIEDKADARKYRIFWYVWALYAVFPGIWLALIYLDTIFGFPWNVDNIPDTIKPYADQIIYSLFGSGGLVGAAQAISSAIRKRR